MPEFKQKSPLRSSLIKNGRDLIEFCYQPKDIQDRSRSKSVTFNKAVILNLLEESSDDGHSESEIDEQYLTITALNLERMYNIAASSYLDQTFISTDSEVSESLTLELNSATDVNESPGKSFLQPLGYNCTEM